MAERFHELRAEGVVVRVDLSAGHIRSFEVTRAGRTVAPLHTAPWMDEPAVTGDESLPGNLRALSGDFFCAPFSASDVEPGPPHGWPANSPWTLVEHRDEPDGATATFRLDRTVLGATVDKVLSVRHGHPALYERHVFTGGRGAVPVANHAMVAMREGGRVSFSPKSIAETPARPLEPDPARGRFRLAYPARTEDLTAVPAADGSTVDLTRYPIGERHEDFLMLVEARASRLGWAAALRHGTTRDLVVSLKNPAELPVTMLWFSNGGRDYAPWNGRHVGVLGFEEGRTYGGGGHRASIEPNPLSDAGTPTALTLDPDGAVSVRNVLVALPVPGEWSLVADIAVATGGLKLTDAGGSSLSVPFDAGFLG